MFLSLFLSLFVCVVWHRINYPLLLAPLSHTSYLTCRGHSMTSWFRGSGIDSWLVLFIFYAEKPVPLLTKKRSEARYIPPVGCAYKKRSEGIPIVVCLFCVCECVCVLSSSEHVLCCVCVCVSLFLSFSFSLSLSLCVCVLVTVWHLINYPSLSLLEWSSQ